MKKVLLLLSEGFEIYEASAFIDVIGWNLIDGDGTTQLFTCGLNKEVNSTFRQKMIVDYTIDEINPDEFAALAIPGGFEEYDFYKNAFAEPFLNLIRAFNQKNKLISSICTGAMPIAKSGILNGKKGTTYNMGSARQKMLSDMGVHVVQEPIVTEGNIITSWNPSTAMDVAFLLLEHLTSKKQVEHMKGLMGFH
jgi:4-methyl-5(b-hydroxyethyl)-thiazole monophosphate biosynthesis